MADRIEVAISDADYPVDWDLSQDKYESWLVGQLKEAGIPVLGHTRYGGLKSGVLISMKDPVNIGVTRYIWREKSA